MSAGCACTGFCENFQRTVFGLLEAGHRVTEREAHTMLFQATLNKACHFRIERRHDLIEHLNNGHFQPAMDQVFRHLETDESAADDHRAFRFRHGLKSRLRVIRQIIPRNPRVYFPGIRDGPHREDPRKVNAGQGRTDRRRAGREHQLVVFLGRYLAGYVVLELHGFIFRGNPDDFTVRPAIDRELFTERSFR